MIKKTDFDISVHLKKVYMMSEESIINRDMHDMPRKLTLLESYLVRPITYMYNTCLQGWFQFAVAQQKL